MGVYFADFGPEQGYLLAGTAPVMGIQAAPQVPRNTIGIAWLNGSVPSRWGPVQVWRLEVHGKPVEGRWVVKDRCFVRIGDATERSHLLRFHLLARALYEIVYEANNRPDWIETPVRGVIQLLDMEAGG